MTDAYEDLNSQYVAAGKAKPIDYTKCPCGYHTHCKPQQDGSLWVCSDAKCANKPRFEKFNK